MSKKLGSEVGKFMLPFSVLSGKKEEPFTSDLELAAVFSIAELNRRKVGRLARARRILGRSIEKTSFIAKIGYPLWLYPLSNRVLLFDGLNVSEYALPYALISIVQAFTESLKAGSKTRDTYMAFLADHTNYFVVPAEEKSFPIKGLIGDSKFLGEGDLYRREAVKMGDQQPYFGLLPSAMDESRLSFITHELANLRSVFEKEVKALDNSIQMLGKATQTFHTEFHSQMKAVKEEFALKIAKEEKIVAPKVDALRDEYDKRIMELARNFESRQLPLHTEKLKLEKSKVEANAKVERYSLETRARAEDNDKVNLEQWKEKIKDAKQELSAIQDQLKANEKALKDLEKERASEAFRLKSELETDIKETRKNIVELEAVRDAKTLVIRQEMEKLENLTKLLTDKIGKTVKLREADISRFEKLSMKPYSEELDKALVYVPFYVVCYDSGRNKRFLILPPSSIGTIDISTRLKGALGRARIKGFLVPRFKGITSLADTIQAQIQENSIFETELKEIGAKNNILALSSLHALIEKGLLSLKNQGWLSDKDYGAIVANARTNLNMRV